MVREPVEEFPEVLREPVEESQEVLSSSQELELLPVSLLPALAEAPGYKKRKQKLSLSFLGWSLLGRFQNAKQAGNFFGMLSLGWEKQNIKQAGNSFGMVSLGWLRQKHKIKRAGNSFGMVSLGWVCRCRNTNLKKSRKKNFNPTISTPKCFSTQKLAHQNILQHEN